MDATSPARVKPVTTQKTRRRTRLPFLIADGYLFGEVAGATLRGLGWFAGLLLAFAVIAAVRRVVDNSITWAGMGYVVLYSMPRIILFTLPMSALYGTVQAFSDLSAKGEVSALWAGGMGLLRMLRAPLAWALMLAVLAFWTQEALVPGAEREKKDVAVRYAVQAAASATAIRWTEEKSDNSYRRIVQAKRFDPVTKTLVEPRIVIFDDKTGAVAQEISAERAVWNVKTGKWKFYNGDSRTTAVERGELSDFRSTFDQIELETGKDAPNPKLLGAKQLSLRENLELRNFEMVSIGDLQQHLAELRHAHEATNNAAVRLQHMQRIKGVIFGIHDKIATPLIVIALVLIGVPLGIRPQRSGGGFAMGISLVVVLMYYVLWTWVTQIGKAGFYNPIVLAYLPLAIILSIAIILVRKKS